MAPRQLGPEIVALVHHVELNKAGWWKKSLEKLLVSVLWLSGDLSTAEVRDSLRSTFGVDTDLSGVEDRLAALHREGKVHGGSGGSWRLARECVEALEAQVAEADRIVEGASDRFKQLVRESCPELDPAETWAVFDREFLLPFIRKMGARTYELVSGKALNVPESADFREFLDRYPERQRVGVRDAAVAFLDPRDLATRAYVLRLLNGWFALQAANFDAATLKRLERSQSTRPGFVVFVDTNFLFSILGLHENPSNEAAERLMWLASELKGRVDLRFYVAPTTVDEARGVLDWVAQDARGMNLGRNLAVAAEETGDIGGILLKYLEESKKAGRTLDIDEYFGPYRENLVAIVRGKQVDLFNERMDDYTMRADVVDDVNDQLAFEKSLPSRRRKTYEALLHDMMLWHLAKDKRPAIVESLLDARYWIVTVDFRFIAFDSFKRRGLDQLPICVHPGSLIQALQFWVPRSDELEAALADSFRLPLLAGNFDAAAERVTMAILRALSRFEDIEDLSEQTIGAILMNEALRQKLGSEPNVERQVELVREAVIEEFSRLKGELGQAQAELERLQQEVSDRARTESVLTDRIDGLEARLKDEEEQKKATAERRSFLFLCALLPLAATGALGSALAFVLQLKTGLDLWQSMLGAWSLVLIVWTYAVRLMGGQRTRVASWPLFQLFARAHAYLFGFLLVTFATSVLGAAAYDFIKSHH